MKNKTLHKIKNWLSFSLVIVIVFTIFLKLIEPAFAQNPPFQTQPANLNDVDGDGIPNSIDASNDAGQEEPFNWLDPTNSANSVNTETTYTPLAPLPGLDGAYDTTGECPLGRYLNIMIKLIIGIATVLAMVMIVLGGMEYMTSELISSKEAGKEKIKNAIIGLLIALGAWLILNTINPTLLNVCLGDIPKVNLEVGGDSDAPIGNTASLPSDIVCGGGQNNINNIANSFAGNMTYKFGAKGTAGPNGTINLDCSGFANYVLKCAGMSFTNGGTASIFSGAQQISSVSGYKVNGVELKKGDLVGWKPGDNSRYSRYGHVFVYIGNGMFADSHGGSSAGNALGIFSISKYYPKYKLFVKRSS